MKWLVILLCALLAFTGCGESECMSWTALTTYSENWIQLVTSADGLHSIVRNYGGGGDRIETSGNINICERNNVQSVAISSDGAEMVAFDGNGWMWVSDNSGETWTAISTSAAAAYACTPSLATMLGVMWSDLAGAYVLALSTDSGVNWEPLLPPHGQPVWGGGAIAADGQTMYARVSSSNSAKLWRSLNAGATWAECGDAHYYTGLTCSANGSKVYTCSKSGGNILVSSDYGASWAVAGDSPAVGWTDIKCTPDGTKLIASCNDGNSAGGYVYTSADGGTTWTQEDVGIVQYWGCVSLSDDGQYLFAGVGEVNPVKAGLVYFTQKIAPPVVRSFPWVGKFQLSHVT